MKTLRGGVAAVLLGLSAGAGAAQPAPAGQYTSGGLDVKLNRATKPDQDGNFVISLIVTNTEAVTTEMFTMRGVQAISNRGGTYEDVSLGGLPFCIEYEPRNCHAAITKGTMAPLTIDPGKSAVVTLSFAGEAPKGAACAIDLSLPIHKRDYDPARPDTWRVVAVGMPSIRVC